MKLSTTPCPLVAYAFRVFSPVLYALVKHSVPQIACRDSTASVLLLGGALGGGWDWVGPCPCEGHG